MQKGRKEGSKSNVFMKKEKRREEKRREEKRREEKRREEKRREEKRREEKRREEKRRLSSFTVFLKDAQQSVPSANCVSHE